MVVLGLDPGLANTGWGVVEVKKNQLKYLAHGCISTDSTLSQGARLNRIFESIETILLRYRPEAAGIETLYFAKNRTSALSVAQARGILLLLLERYRVNVKELTPNQIKQAVTGEGSADKKAVAKMVQFLLGLSALPTPDHSADALAAAIGFYLYHASPLEGKNV